MTDNPKAPVLYVITCATLAATSLDVLVKQAKDVGWDVWVVSTPSGTNFVDAPLLEELTGHPVRFEYRRPDQPKQAPPADGVILAGASFNTINKWAAGIADNLAMSLFAELLGNVPLAVLPFLTSQLAAHPAFHRSLDALHEAGAAVLVGPDSYQPHPSGTGPEAIARYPWHQALQAVSKSSAR